LAASGQDASTGWTTGPSLPVTSDSSGVHLSGTWDTTTATDEVSGVHLDARVPNLLDIEVCVTYSQTSIQCSWTSDPTQVLRLAHAFGDGFPTTDVPGGQVALWTGEFATSSTDASLQAGTTSLSVGRSAATYDGTSSNPAEKVFGTGWTANLTGDDSGYAGAEVVDSTVTQGTIAVLDGDGNTMVFAPATGQARRTTADLAASSWVALDDSTRESGVTAKIAGSGPSTVLTLTDPDGTATTFGVTSAPTSGTAATFVPIKVQQPGNPTATSYTYDGQGRVTRILAPVPAGVTCPDSGDMPAGCRALAITYATSSATTAPGDYVGQVKTISTLVGTGPASNPSTVSATVASYAYDSSGRLVTVTDPRTGLATSYGYDGTSPRISEIKPAGQTPIDYVYNSGQQLTQVTRTRPGDAPAGTADLATIVYGIPNLRNRSHQRRPSRPVDQCRQRLGSTLRTGLRGGGLRTRPPAGRRDHRKQPDGHRWPLRERVLHRRPRLRVEHRCLRRRPLAAHRHRVRRP
jgi:YD repeat-containing protein